MSRKKKRKQAEVIAEGSGEVDVRALEVALAGSESVHEPMPEPVPETGADIEAEASAEAAAGFDGDASDGAIEVAAEAEAAADPDSGMGTGDEPEPGSADIGYASAAARMVEGVEPPAEPADDEAAPEAVLPAVAAALDPVQLRRLVEALVFAADKPLTLVRLRQLTRVSDTSRLEQALAELAEEYRDRGIALQQVSGGYQMRTNPQFSAWVQQLIAGRPVRLSRAQLETLAIVAYRQPITRPEIDEIRGVDSSNTLRVLIDRSLIRILGKKEEVGRPLLYGTTKEFLDFFSLGDLRELPTLREYSELTDESRKVMSDRLGVELGEPARAGSAPEAEVSAEAPAGGDVLASAIEPAGDGDAIELTELTELPSDRELAGTPDDGEPAQPMELAADAVAADVVATAEPVPSDIDPEPIAE